jgi:hypothetical protein
MGLNSEVPCDIDGVVLTQVDIAIEELSQAGSQVAEVGEYFRASSQIKSDLDAVVEFLKEKTVLSCESANLANFGIEGLREQLNLSGMPLVFSAESIRSKSDISVAPAVEGLGSTITAAQSAVSNGLSTLMVRVSDYLDKYKRALTKVRELQADVQARVNLIKPKGKPVFDYVKPEHWCEQLMYVDSGFIRGLKGIETAVSKTLTEHKQAILQANVKYRKWAADNGEKMMAGDYKAIDSLEFKPEDFVVSGGKVYTQSVGYKVPTGENVFYQGAELPGGMCIYTEAYRVRETGVHAIAALKSVGYFLGVKNPGAYSRARKELTEQVALSFGAWAWTLLMISGNNYLLYGKAPSMFPVFPLAAAYGAQLVGWHWAKLADPGKKVTIDKKILFETLSPAEIATALKDVEKGLAVVEDWRSIVLNKSLGDRTNGFDKYMELLGNSSLNAYRGRSVEQLKDLVLGLINLTQAGQCGLDVYALKTYTAMLKYVDQSARRYIDNDQA